MNNYRFAIVQNGKYGFLVEKFDMDLGEWVIVFQPVYRFNSYPEALDSAILMIDSLNARG